MERLWVYGGYGNSVQCVQFCCETALKNEVYFKNKSLEGENEICYVPTWG